MKIVKIAKPNQKGQIVIPKEIREKLKIDSKTQLKIQTRGEGVYIQPIEEFITREKEENTYPNLLKDTQGAWAEDNWEQTRKQRKKIERNASQRRKKGW